MSDISEFKARFQRLAEKRITRDEDKAKAKKSEDAYRKEEAELWEELAEAGIKGTQKFDFGGDLGTISFVSRATIYGSVVDKQVAIKALKELGIDDALNTESIREGRLNELVRDYLESGQELPEGVASYVRKGISISRK